MKEKIKQEILNVLNDHPFGLRRLDLWREVYDRLACYVVTDELADYFTNIEKNDSSLRKLVKELKEEGYPIGSSVARGYFIIRNQNDFDEAVETYQKKIAGMFKVIKDLKATAERFIGSQLELNLGGYYEKEVHQF